MLDHIPLCSKPLNGFPFPAMPESLIMTHKAADDLTTIHSTFSVANFCYTISCSLSVLKTSITEGPLKFYFLETFLNFPQVSSTVFLVIIISWASYKIGSLSPPFTL